MSVIIASDYEKICKLSKALVLSTEKLKQEFASVRKNLDKVYRGQTDLESRFKSIEKQLDMRSKEMALLTVAMNSVIREVVQLDNSYGKKVIVSDTNTASLSGVFQLAYNLVLGADNPLGTFIAKYTNTRWEELTGTLLDCTLLPLGGLTFTYAGIGWLSKLMQADSVIDDFIEKHQEEAKEAAEEEKAMQEEEQKRKEEEEQKKREAEEKARLEAEKAEQLANRKEKMDSIKGIIQPVGGPCWYISKANLLHRRKVYDTGVLDNEITYEQCKDRFNKKSLMTWNTNSFSDVKGYGDYNIKTIDMEKYCLEEKFNEIDKFLNPNSKDYRPEGIIVHGNYPKKNKMSSHAIVITDYEILPDGTKQYYVMDSGSGTEYQRVRIQDSQTYKNYIKHNPPASVEKMLNGYKRLEIII